MVQSVHASGYGESMKETYTQGPRAKPLHAQLNLGPGVIEFTPDGQRHPTHVHSVKAGVCIVPVGVRKYRRDKGGRKTVSALQPRERRPYVGDW